MENVKELLRRTLRENRMCCCAGDFQCQNCKLLDCLQEPREYNCPLCLRMVAQMANQLTAEQLVSNFNENEMENVFIQLLLYAETNPEGLHRLCMMGAMLYGDTFRQMAQKMKEMAEVTA